MSAKRGRISRKSDQKSHNFFLFQYFTPTGTDIPVTKCIRQIVNDVVDTSVDTVDKKNTTKKTRLGICVGQNCGVMEMPIPMADSDLWAG